MFLKALNGTYSIGGIYLDREIYRGDIYYANLDGSVGSEQKGNRPVIIVQNDVGNKFSKTVIIVPLTKKFNNKVKQPTHIQVKPFGKIKVDSTVLAEQIRVIDKKRLIRKMGKLPQYLEDDLNKALEIAIGI